MSSTTVQKLVQANDLSLAASVDWLTLTALSKGERYALAKQAQAFLEKVRSENRPIKPWRFKGYAGWTTDHMSAGTRDDSEIVMLSGPLAQVYWLDYVQHSCHCTRIDLAVTLHLAKPDEMLLMDYWDALVDKRDAKNWRTHFTIMFNSQIGQTLYVGSRHSEGFGRIYDKGAEKPDDGFPNGIVWRYEVEHKGEQSRAALRALLKTHKDGADVPSAIADYVHKWFKVRYCEPRWPKNGNAISLEISAEVNSDAKRIKWLTTQVRPTITELTARGLLPEVLTALDLDGVVEIRKLISERPRSENGRT